MLTKSLSRILLVATLVSLWLSMPGGIFAQNAAELAPVTRVLAFTQVNVITAPGQMIEKATVIVRDGLITNVGKDVPIPADARVIEADSLFMYAGFIEALSHTGVPKEKEEQNGSNAQGNARGPQRGPSINPANPPNERAGIQPDRAVKDMLDPEDKSIEEMRQLGFTAAHIVPQGRMLPGSGAIILLGGEAANDMLLKDQSAQYAQFAGANRVYPATVIAIMAKFRELYRQAELARQHEAAYAARPAGMQRPNYDPVLRAFFPVINKQQAIFFHTESSLDAYRAITLQKDLGFPLVLVELKTAQDLLPAIQKHALSVCLTLDLPKDNSKKEIVVDEKLEGTALILAKENAEMYKRQAEALKKHEGQAAAVAAAGIPFSFSTLDMKSRDFSANLQRMHKAGLSEKDLLAALTTNPAKLLGVDAMLGTIEKGKIANMVVMNKKLLEEKAQVRYVVVDGKLYEYDIKERKKGSGGSGEAVKAAGTWSYFANIPGRETEGTLIITGEPGNYSGTISSTQGGGSLDIENVVMDGNVLSFSYSIDGGGQTFNITVEVEIEGDSFEGELTAGQFGSFPMEGERTGKPD